VFARWVTWQKAGDRSNGPIKVPGGDLNEAAPQLVTASFETVDDLLWQAVAGRLPKLGSITLARSGRIGPLVELAMATAALPDRYSDVSSNRRSFTSSSAQ
jgi:hypothetical protein